MTLTDLDAALNAAENLLRRGNTVEAAGLIGRTIDAFGLELDRRGIPDPAREPAIFEDLLLAAQVERELQAVKERARGSR